MSAWLVTHVLASGQHGEGRVGGRGIEGGGEVVADHSASPGSGQPGQRHRVGRSDRGARLARHCRSRTRSRLEKQVEGESTVLSSEEAHGWNDRPR